MKHKKRIPRQQPPFKQALAAAKAELAAKTKHRMYVLIELQNLNVDIPNLERTCRALEAQLSGRDGQPSSISEARVKPSAGPVSGHASPAPSLSRKDSLPDATLLNEIPPEIRAQLPPEDLSKFGSHFGDAPAEQEDFLPEITEGKELIPEKK